jgi:hypothetical protein
MSTWRSGSPPTCRQATDLLFETSVPETGEYVYVGLELIRPLPDLPGSVT